MLTADQKITLRQMAVDAREMAKTAKRPLGDLRSNVIVRDTILINLGEGIQALLADNRELQKKIDGYEQILETTSIHP